MKTSIHFILLAISSFQIGCGDATQKSSPNRNERAQSLIDQGFYSEAIITLDDRLQIDPQDSEARLLLASALAARSGIILVRFIHLARTIAAHTQPVNSLQLNGLELLSWQIDLVFVSIGAIPNLVSINGMNDIERAIKILTVPELSPGGFLYRALLKLVALKFNIDNNFRFEIDNECKVKPQLIMNWFDSVSAALTNILADIELSATKPEQKAKIASVQTDMMEVSTAIHGMLENNLDKPRVTMPKFFSKIYASCQ